MKSNLKRLICTITIATALLGVSTTAFASDYNSGCKIKWNTNCWTWKQDSQYPNCGNKQDQKYPDCGNKQDQKHPDCGNKQDKKYPNCANEQDQKYTDCNKENNTTDQGDGSEETKKPDCGTNVPSDEQTKDKGDENKVDKLTPEVNKEQKDKNVEEGTLGVNDIKNDNEDNTRKISGVKTGDNSKLPIYILLASIGSGALFVVNKFMRK